MEGSSRRGPGRRKLASGGKAYSGRKSSLRGPLTFTLTALRESLSAFDGEGKLPFCCEITYLNACTIMTQSLAQAVIRFTAIAGTFGAHIQPPDVETEYEEDTARPKTTHCVIQMVSML